MPIEIRKNKDGSKAYRVTIRKKGTEVTKTFSNEEDAILFENYRTRLIECMANFEVPIKDRVRLVDIVDLKIKRSSDLRSISEFELANKRVMEVMKPHIFLNELTYDDWKDAFEKIAKKEYPKRHNSPHMQLIAAKSLRRIFASLSSAFSTAIANGISLENWPLKIVQEIINPSIKAI